jgi:hypothetical protein
MKKALTLVVLMITPAIIFAQGIVQFDNRTGLVQQWTSAADPTLISVPKDGGYVQLIAAPQGTPLLHSLGVYVANSGFIPQYSSIAGFLADNPGWGLPWNESGTALLAPAPLALAPGINNGPYAVIDNIGNGADADYLVIGWTGPYASFDAAYAADVANPNSSFLGVSAIATTHTGAFGPVHWYPAVPLRNTFQGMTLAPAVIPEPTTALLAGLGAALLLLLRGRC